MVCETRRVDYPVADYQLPRAMWILALSDAWRSVISDQFARKFINETIAWDSNWINDRGRETPMFPRAVQINEDQQQRIDQLLDECGVLKFRCEP